MLVDFFEQVLLDVEVLDDGFDDPVNFRESRQVIGEIAGLEAARVIGL